MSNIAWGQHICLSTPHYRATASGIEEYFAAPATRFGMHHCALKAALSLQFHLPHLCGVGGDAMIIERVDGKLGVINGTGKTASHQCTDSYAAKGMATIPRRGVYSTMVYGAPRAFSQLVQQRQVELPRLIDGLLKQDCARGFVKVPAMTPLFQKAYEEMSPTTSLQAWRALFEDANGANAGLVATMQRLAACGFDDLYRGDLAEATWRQIGKFDAQLYDESDFSAFTPNASEVRSIVFFDATVSCHGSNSPWRELFLLLKMLECIAVQGRTVSDQALCDLAAHAEAVAPTLPAADPDIEAQIAVMAQALVDAACDAGLTPKDIVRKQSHTVFIAGVNEQGDLIGISNSIFTPLGALFEVEHTGILLSNRCFAFNEGDKDHQFKPNSPVRHSNNCVVVDSPTLSFVIGTSGGPVQSQTLSSVIHKIVAGKRSVRDAVHAARIANTGMHPKTGKICYLSEGRDCAPPFQATDGLSDKLGVVQVAGIEKKSGRLFSVADPRGCGIALGY